MVKKYNRKKDLQNPQTIKKMAIGTYISIITLNVNGLNVSTKTGQLHVKNEIRTLLNTIHKDKPKIN